MRNAYLISLALLFACNGGESDTACTFEELAWSPGGEDAESFTLEVSDDWSVERSRCVETFGEASVYTAEPCVDPQTLETEDVTELFERSDEGLLCLLDPPSCNLGETTAGWTDWTDVTVSWRVCQDAAETE